MSVRGFIVRQDCRPAVHVSSKRAYRAIMAMHKVKEDDCQTFRHNVYGVAKQMPTLIRQVPGVYSNYMTARQYLLLGIGMEMFAMGLSSTRIANLITRNIDEILEECRSCARLWHSRKTGRFSDHGDDPRYWEILTHGYDRSRKGLESEATDNIIFYANAFQSPQRQQRCRAPWRYMMIRGDHFVMHCLDCLVQEVSVPPQFFGVMVDDI